MKQGGLTNTQVAFELSVPGKSLVTEAADEPFLPCVDRHVISQIHLLGEAFSAERAAERFFSRVSSQVDLQMWAAAKYFPTL